MEFRHPKEIWKDPRSEIIDFGRVFAIGVFIISSVHQCIKNNWDISWSTFCNSPETLLFWWGIAGIILSLSTFVPWLIRPIYFLWMLLGQSLGQITQKIILTFIFFALFTPVGLLYRRHCRAITKKIEKDCDSYWEKKEISSNKKNYYRQF